MTRSVDEDVVRLEVSVDEVQLMDALHCQDCLGHVEASHLLREDVLLHEHVHEVSSREVLHDQIEIVLVRKGGLELDDPVGVRLGKDVPLGSDVVHLILLVHYLFGHLFYCHQRASRVSAESDLSEGSSTNNGKRSIVQNGLLDSQLS